MTMTAAGKRLAAVARTNTLSATASRLAGLNVTPEQAAALEAFVGFEKGGNSAPFPVDPAAFRTFNAARVDQGKAMLHRATVERAHGFLGLSAPKWDSPLGQPASSGASRTASAAKILSNYIAAGSPVRDSASAAVRVARAPGAATILDAYRAAGGAVSDDCRRELESGPAPRPSGTPASSGVSPPAPRPAGSATMSILGAYSQSGGSVSTECQRDLQQRAAAIGGDRAPMTSPPASPPAVSSPAAAPVSTPATASAGPLPGLDAVPDLSPDQRRALSDYLEFTDAGLDAAGGFDTSLESVLKFNAGRQALQLPICGQGELRAAISHFELPALGWGS